jgi:hypothetical protein
MTTRIMWIDSTLDAQLRVDLDRGMIPTAIPEDDMGEAKSCTLIQTAHSIYLFLGSTPADPRGLLVGGVVGECPTDAFLVGAISTSNSELEYPTSLATGSRAVFHILSNRGCRRVVTSPIVKLVYTHVHGCESLGTVH